MPAGQPRRSQKGPGWGRRVEPGRLRQFKSPSRRPGWSQRDRPGRLQPKKNPSEQPGWDWRDRPHSKLEWGWQNRKHECGRHDRELEHGWSRQGEELGWSRHQCKEVGRLRDGLLASRGLWSRRCELPVWSGLCIMN